MYIRLITTVSLLLSLLLFNACSGSSNRTCSTNDGCLAGEVCKSGYCSSENDGNCNVCTAGKKRCVSGKSQTCIKLSSGCTDWGEAKSCSDKKVCQNGECQTVCQDECRTLGDKKCLDKASYQICTKSEFGCLSWAKQTSCQGGEICQDGSCKAAKKSEGERCQSETECTSGLQCVGRDTTGYFCRRFCSRSQDCKSDEGCYEIKGGSKLCLPTNQNGPPSDAKCQIYVDSAKISGGNWDAGGGAPDPYVSISFASSAASYVTSTKSDSFNPVWKDLSGRNYTYADIYSMTVRLKDEDLTSDDLMVEWTPDGGRWKMTNPNNQYFNLGTKDGSISLKIEVRCTF